QLAEARRMAEKSRLQLERSNAYLENVLSTLSSGVLVFDDAFRVTKVNQGAQRILNADMRTLPGAPLETIPHVASFARAVRQAFAEHTAAATGRHHWQQQIEVTRHVADEAPAASTGAPPEPFSHGHDSVTTAILL